MGKSGWVPLYNANSSTVNNLKSSSSSSTVNNFNLKRRAATRATKTPNTIIIILLFFIRLLRSRRSWPKRMNQRGLGEWGASASKFGNGNGFDCRSKFWLSWNSKICETTSFWECDLTKRRKKKYRISQLGSGNSLL